MCARAFKCIFDSVLLLLLCGQTVLLLLLTFRGYWEIPTWLVERVLDRHVPASLSVEVEVIRFYPGKGLEVLGVRLDSTECACPLVTIEKILIVPSDPSFEMGRSESAEGLIRNAVVYFPDPFLPESENLQLINDLTLRFDINRNTLELRSLKAKISRLTVASRNALVLEMPLFGGDKQAPGTREFPSDAVFRKLREIRFIHDSFAEAEQALLTITFDPAPDPLARYAADLNLYAASSVMREQVSTQGVFLEGRVLWDGFFFVEDLLRGEIQSMRYEQQVVVEDLAFAFSYLRDGNFSLLPDEISLQAAGVAFLDRRLDFLGASVWPERTGQGRLEASLGFAGESFSLSAAFDLEAEHLRVAVGGDFDPLTIASAWTEAMDDFSLFHFEATPHLRAQFEVDSWREISAIDFRVVGESVVAKGVRFDYGRTWGQWDGAQRRIVLDTFVAQRPGYTLEGSLENHLKTSEYRYQIMGRGIPTDLNPMFLPWWSSIWEDFDFRGNPIHVDLDIRGVDDDLSDRFVHGAIAFQNLDYDGLDIEFGQVRLNVIARYVQLLDLFVKTPQGVVAGDVNNVYDPHEGNQVSQRLDLYTNLPLHTLAPLVGEDLDPIVENTRPEAVADVWLRGALIKEAYPQHRYLDDLSLRVQLRRPTWVFGFEIDAADTFIRKRQNRVEVNPVDLRFAGGRGDALFVVFDHEGEMQVDFSVDLRDFDFRKAIDKVEGLQEREFEVELTLPERRLEDRLPASEAVVQVPGSQQAQRVESGGFSLGAPVERSFMNLRIAGSSPAGSLEGLLAWGDFELDDPLIHRVHLFGGVSKVFDHAELDLGSFSLKRASSPLRVEGRHIYFEDLEITGPTSRVRSKGVVNFDDGSLDFRLKAYPLREVRFPVIAGLALMLRPFAHLFEVQLSGTLEEPEWRLLIDPSGL